MALNGLTTEREQFVKQEIAQGKDQSTEEVASAALRLLQDHESQDHNGHCIAHGHDSV